MEGIGFGGGRRITRVSSRARMGGVKGYGSFIGGHQPGAGAGGGITDSNGY